MVEKIEQTDDGLMQALPILIVLHHGLITDDEVPPALRDLSARTMQVMQHAQRRLRELGVGKPLPVDDFSCDPSRWSFDKLVRERRHGMPAVVAEYNRRMATSPLTPGEYAFAKMNGL